MSPELVAVQLHEINDLLAERVRFEPLVRTPITAIREFGFTYPVLIDEHDQIIAGHGRVAAARLLDLLQVPTLQLSHLSPTQKRAYILADNRLAEKAGWDKEILAVELQGLLDDGFEVVLTGFEVPDVDVVLDAAAEAKSDRHGDDLIPDAGRPFPVPVTSGGWGFTGSSVAVRSTLAPTSHCSRAPRQRWQSPTLPITLPLTATSAARAKSSTAILKWRAVK